MFGKRIDLFTVHGFTVGIDPSWFVIAFLVVWSLANGLFPSLYAGLSTTTYWTMGMLGALGLFTSIVFHEFAHALVAQHYGITMRGITLFLFGGVAEMADEPSRPRVEFIMTIAGPIASMLLALIFFGMQRLGQYAAWPVMAVGVSRYLTLINGALAVFNLIPAFPLDGGRILRSLLWHWKGNLRWATRITAQIGAWFGIFLIGLGFFSLLAGSIIGGIWWALIGLFLRGAAITSYQQLVMRQLLEGQSISRFMTTDPVTAPPSISIAELVDGYIFRHHYKLYPVVENERLIGCVTTQQVKAMPRESWYYRCVGEVVQPRSAENTVAPDTDAMQVFTRMTQQDISRLMVADGDRLLGVITLKDLMQFFALRLEFEEQPI